MVPFFDITTSDGVSISLPIVRVYIGGYEVLMLFDTGASDVVLTRDLHVRSEPTPGKTVVEN